MAAYFLPPSPPPGADPFDCIVRDDGAWIPDNPSNSDWQAYQAWLAEGNTAQPYSEWAPPAKP